VTVRLNGATVTAIQKSGQSASDWLRQAVRSRLESERQTGATAGAEEKQLAALQQRIDDLKKDGIDTRKEIAKLHQSNAIAQAAQAETRKVLVAIHHNQAELQRALVAMENGIGNTLAALGPTLLAAINQQLDQHAQAALAAARAKEERLRALVPPAPPRTRL
jgi:hypothetical protein